MAFDLTNYAWCIAGIVISVLLPIGWAAVRQYFPVPSPTPGAKSVPVGAIWAAMWPVIKPYTILGFVSAITAILLIAFLGDAIVDWRAALLAGYAWDATLQKLAK
jgi:hypothetical protein